VVLHFDLVHDVISQFMVWSGGKLILKQFRRGFCRLQLKQLQTTGCSVGHLELVSDFASGGQINIIKYQ